MEDPTAASEIWKEILRLEPLTGEHWETSSYYESKDDSDSELIDDSSPKTIHDKLNSEMKCLSLQSSETDRIASNILVPPLPKNEIKQILDVQYWTQPEVKTWNGEGNYQIAHYQHSNCTSHQIPVI
ncbi:hypothetical protein K7432_008022 [Basidiobolus ranarum]|uniref:Uncharacterized protein n=1 Tax=Basidiobolus ranarum TaxID=34480 RepID=A0ABR2WSF9_9FUNG